MPDTEDSLSGAGRKRSQASALELGPRKKPCNNTDPLTHYGRHFCRTVHALCNFQTLLTNGLLKIGELADVPDEDFTAEQRREHAIFQELLKAVPGLEERLVTGSDDEVTLIAELIRKGASGARGDDTKSLKGAILDWITPKGQALMPPLSRNVKTDRGFHHERTGALLCPVGLDWSTPDIKAKLRSGEIAVSGDQWPLFVYAGYSYDHEDPWNGLLRSGLLVSAFKYVFTSPSSVEKEPKATRSGNARIHGMTRITPAAIAYIATQVRFALSSSPVFSRTDTVTDSERFYNSILELLDDPNERQEVDELLTWWNRQVFPACSSAQREASKDSVLARIREKRVALQTAGTSVTNTSS